MSQSETLMLIVLGFAIATFLALIVGRLAWKLAVRVGARRVQRNVPVTVVDLQNDRDRLRAEQAILARKIEVRLDEMKLRMAEQSAEVTRNRNRVETLMQQITDQESIIADRDAEVARLSSKISSLQKELANTKSSSETLQQALQAKDVEFAGLHEKFLSKLDDARLPAPALPAGSTTAPQPSLEEANARLTSRIREITSISDELAGSKQNVSDGNVNTDDVTDRIFVKPAGTQQMHSRSKSKSGKKASRSTSVAESQSLEVEAENQTAASVTDMTPATAAENQTTVEEPPPETAADSEGASRPVTNVISLAQRIKALQREIAG